MDRAWEKGRSSPPQSLGAHYNPSADRPGHGVDEEDQEDDEDDEDEADDDVLLVIPPDEVVQAFEGIHKPREGSVRAAGREGREKSAGRQVVSTSPGEMFLIPTFWGRRRLCGPKQDQPNPLVMMIPASPKRMVWGRIRIQSEPRERSCHPPAEPA